MEKEIKLLKYDESKDNVLDELKQDEEVTNNVTSIFYDKENKYLITYNNINVGVIIIEREFNEIYSIDIAIIKQYRNLGIGKVAINKALDILSYQSDCKNILLRTSINNKAIQKIAIDCGFNYDISEVERCMEEGVPFIVYSKPNSLIKTPTK